MPEQRNKYNIPHLKVSLEATFTAMTRAYKKAFIFRQGNCTMNVLHPFLSKSFALSIWSTDSKKNHDCSLEDNYCVLFVKLKFLIPTYVTCFVRQSLQKFTEKLTSWVPFREIVGKNIHFCGLKKETFIFNERKT